VKRDEVLLEGDKIRLRRPEEPDVQLFLSWFKDEEVRFWLHLSEQPEVTERDARHRLGVPSGENASRESSTSSWVIEDRSDRVIGGLSLLGIDRIHGRAELAVCVGDKTYWSRGYGTDAITVLLRQAFDDLGLRRVWLITDADNLRAIRCFEKCGFVREGLLKAYRLRRGKPVDMVIMGILRSDPPASR
jgi:RimJ/RimL family protein N-acetyltransferase